MGDTGISGAVPSVGLLDIDLEALGIDALAVSTQKGLLGLYGLGLRPILIRC